MKNNSAKSAALMAGFVLLALVFWWAIALLITAIGAQHGPSSASPTFFDILAKATAYALRTAPLLLLLIGGWFLWAYRYHADLIRRLTGARALKRFEAPELYNLVENLALSAGLPMPRIDIIETDARNAYASGLSPDAAVIVVTKGLLDALDKRELEAVLAHELAHIKNYDTRLMLVATVFAGGLMLLGDTLVGLMKRRAATPEPVETSRSPFRFWRRRSFRGSGRQGNGGPAVLLAMAVAIVLLVMTYVLAMLTKFALSRTREFLADAGAVELTKSPDALISALRKISGHDAMPAVPAQFQAMMISSRVDGWMATHPPLSERIAALERVTGLHASTDTQMRAPDAARRTITSTQSAVATAMATIAGDVPMGAMAAAPSATARAARPLREAEATVAPEPASAFGRRRAVRLLRPAHG